MDERRQDYNELKNMIKDLYQHINSCEDKIIKRFDEHKEYTCVPTRLHFTKKIAQLEVKSGFFGLLGGAVVTGINFLIRKI
jgi:asparagine synthetase A